MEAHAAAARGLWGALLPSRVHTVTLGCVYAVFLMLSATVGFTQGSKFKCDYGCAYRCMYCKHNNGGSSCYDSTTRKSDVCGYNYQYNEGYYGTKESCVRARCKLDPSCADCSPQPTTPFDTCSGQCIDTDTHVCASGEAPLNVNCAGPLNIQCCASGIGDLKPLITTTPKPVKRYFCNRNQGYCQARSTPCEGQKWYGLYGCSGSSRVCCGRKKKTTTTTTPKPTTVRTTTTTTTSPCNGNRAPVVACEGQRPALTRIPYLTNSQTEVVYLSSNRIRAIPSMSFLARNPTSLTRVSWPFLDVPHFLRFTFCLRFRFGALGLYSVDCVCMCVCVC